MEEGDQVNVQFGSVPREQCGGAEVELVNDGMVEVLLKRSLNRFAHFVFVFVPMTSLFFAKPYDAYSYLLSPFFTGALILGLVKVFLLVLLPPCC